MKKFYIYNEPSAERDAVYFDFDGKFKGILGVSFIAETAGDPLTSEEMDVSLDELMGKTISKITDCDADDEAYITGLCEVWGLI